MVRWELLFLIQTSTFFLPELEQLPTCDGYHIRAFILTGKSSNNYYRFTSPRQAANMSVLMFSWSKRVIIL